MMKKAIKKILSLALAFSLVCTMLPLSASAEELDPNIIPMGKGNVRVSGNMVVSYKGPFLGGDDPIVVLPDFANGFELTMIDDNAFSHTGVGVVQLPMNTAYIGKSAFSSMKQLVAVDGSLALTDIDEYAFFNDYLLLNFSFDAPLTFIGKYAFCNCKSLINIKLPPTLDSIGDYAFSGCSGITGDVLIPGSCILGKEVFGGCEGMTRVVFGDYMKEIPTKTFSSCKSLKDVYLPDNLRKIGDRAFDGCKALETLYLPPKVNDIGDGIFYDCTSLKQLYIPNGVTEISSRWYNVPKDLTIHGGAGSYAQQYAKEYGFNFVADYYDYERQPNGKLVKVKNQESTTTTTAKVTVKAKKTGTGTVKLTWNKCSGADGYIVYRKAGSSKKYTKLGTTKKLAYTDKKATSKKKYQYYVAAYKLKNGKKKVITKSKVVTVNIK